MLRLALTLVVLSFSIAPALAGLRFADEREQLTVRSHSSYRAWTIEDDLTGESRVVRQFTSRATGTFDVLPNLDVVFSAAGGFSQDRAGTVSELSGPGDAKLKGFASFLDQHLLVSAGVSLPTGRTQLTDQQVLVSSSIAPHVLGFRMKNYGGGLDADFGLAAGRDLSPRVTVGGGVSGLYRGTYDLDTSSEYTPANELALTAGIDVRASDRTAITVDIVYRMFGTDQLDSEDSYREGGQLELNLIASAQGAKWGGDLVVKNVLKGESELLTALPPGADNRVSNGTNLWLSAAPRYQGNRHWALIGMLDVVVANQSHQQDTSAWALGLGLGGEFRVTEVAILQASISRLSGANEDDTLSLSGLDGVIALRWQY